MKILLVNSDLAKNRGDRAITEGVIQLVHEWAPDAKITGLSEQAARDSEWFGIDFLNIDSQSLSPFGMLKLLRQARASDMVFWGGGELLKDYTNKTALWYWVAKMWLVSLVNSNMYGVYQGIGPTKANSSRRLIRFVVERCKRFVVRDAESYNKLIDWGVDPNKVLSASDPAILPSPSELTAPAKKHLNKTYGINDDFLENFVSIGPRDWFHYKHSGLIPYRYKKKLGLAGKPNPDTAKRHEVYMQSLVEVCETIIQKGHNILLIPMHMSEEDVELCRQLQGSVTNPEKARTLDSDTLSPTELRNVMSYAQAMVGFRLHSTIIATSGLVPCINYYYVDKGRAYFDQIGQSKNAFPIESLLDEGFASTFSEVFDNLIKNRSATSHTVKNKLSDMRQLIQKTFEEMMRSND